MSAPAALADWPAACRGWGAAGQRAPPAGFGAQPHGNVHRVPSGDALARKHRVP